MRLASFVGGGSQRYGIVTSSGIVDLSERMPEPTLAAAISRGLSGIRRHADAPSDWTCDDVTWLPPIVAPTHLIGIGLNTRSHFEETETLMGRKPGDYPRHPRLFTRSPLSQVGHGQPVLIPAASDCLDYEGEIALIIGKPCRSADAATAAEFVAGYSCYNDGSVRDFQMHSNQVTAGKNFVASGAFGPWIVTADEIPDPSRLTLQTRVNGEVRQRLITEDLLFSFGELIAYVSTIFALQPGDTILTGSPAGIGALSQNWLRAGDTVEIDVPQIGTLTNPVAKESPPAQADQPAAP